MAVRPHTQSDMFSLCLRSMKLHFNTFPGQHNHWAAVVSFRQCGDKQIRSFIASHLSRNWMFSLKNGTTFHYRLSRNYPSLCQEVYKLYNRQMVAQLCMNKEINTFHASFYYFVHPRTSVPPLSCFISASLIVLAAGNARDVKVVLWSDRPVRIGQMCL